MNSKQSLSVARKGLLLGVVGVLLFALTLPMTRLATGADGPAQLRGVFIAVGRAAVAGLLAALYLMAVRAPWPPRQHRGELLLTALGVVFGFPLLTSMALQHTPAVHASVIVGLLPLATAAVGAWINRQRASFGFWACALVGSVLVMVYAWFRAGAQGLHLNPADWLLLGAVLCAAFGYVHGARLSRQMRAEHVISWALVLSLPITLPWAWFTRPMHDITPQAWLGFAYVAVFSMWIGFFAWYRGLALGGTLRVSQVQLAQPFLSMIAAVPLLGERVDALTLVFGLAVLASVALGRRMPVQAAAPGPEGAQLIGPATPTPRIGGSTG